jgi:cell division transport system ATP-binding protein
VEQSASWGTIAPPMIQMFHVYKAYPGDPPVLSDINLHVEKGEFIFLTGPSGAGKTTLLKLLFCAEKATKGQILVGGRNIARIRESAIPFLRRNIGVVFQDFKLLPQRTVEDNVAFTLDVLGVPRAEARDKVHRMLKLVGLEHKASGATQTQFPEIAQSRRIRVRFRNCRYSNT